MSSPVSQWTPSLMEAIRLAKKPLITYLVFNVFGFVALFIVVAVTQSGSDILTFGVATVAGLFGILVGQLFALLRLRVFPILLVGGISLTIGGLIMAGVIGGAAGGMGVVAFFFFCFSFPCGMLSLQHNSEILACFWPAVGWIGAAVTLLNQHAKVVDWEKDRVKVWMPIPLALLGFFLLFMLMFLASKQTMRTELWQSLSGAAERRISKRAATLSAIPKRNILPLIVVTLLLFAFTAVLAPYLWRTGKGGDGGGGQHEPSDNPGPKMDGEAFERIVRQMIAGAKSAADTLWPLLVMLVILMILYRPLKRWLLLTHLRSPIFPAPPSERIENLWEYIRIAASDRGIVLTASDSVEDFMRRLPEGMDLTPSLAEAAHIYARTRYGFVLRPGDAQAMREPAVVAAREMRQGMTAQEHVLNWWRELR